MSSIIVETTGRIGHLILSAPTSLNSLTLEMIDALQAGLNQHERNTAVQVIVIRSSSERAFCAGGNMKQLRALSRAGNFLAINGFFAREYALNLSIAQCKKPYIAIIDGVAMGGGLGLSVHGKARIVTEKAVLAMPETHIGFFPDVGASYFLQHLSHNAGLWLALTAATVKGAQAVQTGLATHFVKQENLAKLIPTLNSLLKQGQQSADECLHRCLTELQSTPEDQQFAALLNARSQWFNDANIDLIRQRLSEASEADSDTDHESSDATHLLSLLDSASPFSIKTTLELFAQTSNLSLSACLDHEYQLSATACKHPDFVEGIRAVLVDKDRNPSWQS